MNLSDALNLHAASLRRKNRSQKTIDFYATWLHALDAFTQHKPLDAITLADLRAWMDSLITRGLSANSVRGAAMTAKVFWRWCTRESLIAANIAERLELPARPKRQPDALTTGDVLTLINCVQRTSRNPIRDASLIVFMVETGVRRSELLTLDVGDVHVHQHYAIVIGKGNKQRWVFFGEATEKTLSEWLTVRPTGTTGLWGLSETGLRGILRRVSARTGLAVHPHKLRRTSATLRAARGEPAAALQATFGWERLETANHYVAAAEVQAAAARANPLDGVNLTRVTT